MDAIVAGACGYLLKDASVSELVAGIRAAANGESLVSPAIAAKVLQRLRATGAARARPGDSRRALRPRDPGVEADRQRRRQRPDRGRSPHQPEDGQEPHLEHLDEAADREPHPGRGARRPLRHRLARPAPSRGRRACRVRPYSVPREQRASPSARPAALALSGRRSRGARTRGEPSAAGALAPRASGDPGALGAGARGTSSTAMVVELPSGRVVYARNPDLSLEPASNEKLCVTYTALVELGPSLPLPDRGARRGRRGGQYLAREPRAQGLRRPDPDERPGSTGWPASSGARASAR